MSRTHETFLRVKSAESSDGERWITAWATTPDEDLEGDVVVPTGAKYTLPLPLLAYHRHDAPVGVVTEAHVSEQGIRIRAKLSKGVQLAEELWTLIRDGAVAAVSIGFHSLKAKPRASGGLLFEAWRWLELSLTPVPANPNARIIHVGKAIAYAAEDCAADIAPEPVKVKRAILSDAAEFAQRSAKDRNWAEYEGMTAAYNAAVELLPPEDRDRCDLTRATWDAKAYRMTLRDCIGRLVAVVEDDGTVRRDEPEPKRKEVPDSDRLTPAQLAQVKRMLGELAHAVGVAIGKVVNETDQRLAQAIVQVADKVDRLEETALFDAGYFAEGKEYRKGALVVHDGRTWLATEATDTTPSRENRAWRMLAKRTETRA
ncbi:HK97 family phage prohead protease [Luteimonas wenzhouensis]|uniref:Prohead serine protease domain-containing protein n=1 Tax=Luteimonas wenzhouensis TaxID=2599615 RepID=A0A5C5U7B5_9GAMM|nr:HK97 family phage prohead protease [Luteimonas wenzhouensis]TWT21649.1 hypothetical protein FQY79_00480 [Luteimonas wenzhouensis]